MTSRLPKLLLAAVACASLGGASVATAGNHLKCYKAKETAGPGAFQVKADLVSNLNPPLAKESGCVIKGPPELVCAPVDKQNVSPPPPGGGPTGNTTKFLCYKAKCRKLPDETITAKDQFGTHTFTLKGKAAKTLCAPASPSGAFLDASSVF
jgi:hypothetical protein